MYMRVGYAAGGKLANRDRTWTGIVIRPGCRGIQLRGIDGKLKRDRSVFSFLSFCFFFFPSPPHPIMGVGWRWHRRMRMIFHTSRPLSIPALRPTAATSVPPAWPHLHPCLDMSPSVTRPWQTLRVHAFYGSCRTNPLFGGCGSCGTAGIRASTRLSNLGRDAATVSDLGKICPTGVKTAPVFSPPLSFAFYFYFFDTPFALL